MAGVTDTQQHSGHQQHPGLQLTGRGGWATDETLGVCIVKATGEVRGSERAFLNLHMNMKEGCAWLKM